MLKLKGHKHSTSTVAWRLAIWCVSGACLAAAVWLVMRSEQRWATARQARERSFPALGQPVVTPPANEDTPPRQAPSDGALAPSASTAVQSPAAQPAGEERSEAQPVPRHHRLGPEQAAVQIAMLFDYGCQQCQRVEQSVRALMKRFPARVSLSLWHYPQSTDCNHTLKLNTHPTACQAARAAEAAGIIQGEDGFWKMHSWLFQRMGRISVEELRGALPSLGYDDVDHFLDVMNSAETLDNVLRDVLDAATLGNVGLGTVVMNGVLLESDEVEDAMAQAVRYLEGQPPSAASFTAAPAPSSSGPFSRELLATAVAATVQVVNLLNGDQGSGVLVGKSGSAVYVLTADHLLEHNYRSPDDQTLTEPTDRLEIRTFVAPGAAAAMYRSVQVVARAPDDDLAVLRFSTRRDVPASLRICPPKRVPDEGGFPALSIGWSRGAPMTVVGKVSSQKSVRKRSKHAATLVWELDKPSKPGQSGGPLVDRDGYVVGVASGNSGGHGYFCHTTLIHRLLEQSGLESLYTADSSNEQ
ncbi:MAG TPA: trypsin-like peptidase domain-containing protein [Pirellulales bacterium]|nr:trypsin-like peptidase domain-containing protein [Pirellulales bacterium]